jgi:hypothetical protein
VGTAVWLFFSKSSFGGLVSHTHVTEECVTAVPPEQCGRTTGRGTREQKRPRESCIRMEFGLSGISLEEYKRGVYSPEEAARVPRRPTYGSSMDHPAISALGMPITESMTCYELVSIEKLYQTRYQG